MNETHEVYCPDFIECSICQTNKEDQNRSRITKFFGIENDIQILTKHFYHLTISVQPQRETYYRFSLDPLKKVGRELINGLSSLSSVSNRKWWSLYVESGIRYFSIQQENDEEYPIFNQHMIFYSQKEDLDVRLNTQLKYRLKKINKHFTYYLEYLGQHDIKTIHDSIKLGISVNHESIPMKKFGEEIREEIYKMKGQKPIIFGRNYNKKTTNKLQKTTN